MKHLSESIPVVKRRTTVLT